MRWVVVSSFKSVWCNGWFVMCVVCVFLCVLVYCVVTTLMCCVRCRVAACVSHVCVCVLLAFVVLSVCFFCDRFDVLCFNVVVFVYVCVRRLSRVCRLFVCSL